MHKLTVLAPIATALMALLALAPAAWAVDGVIEINHAKALAGGVTASDTPGYPVTINSTGSYRLTGNLTVPDENTDGIVVSANDVSIDLNGFSIIGPVTCSGSPPTCPHASGTGSGVEVTFPSLVTGTSVKNGSITGMGRYGVGLGYGAKVTNLRARWNLAGGVLVGEGSTVSRNRVDENGLGGISSSSGSVVSGNTVRGNGSHGILVGSGSTVSDNTVRSNGVGVGDYGLWLSGVDSAYSGNVISDNSGGTVFGTAVQLGPNACNGTTTCP